MRWLFYDNNNKEGEKIIVPTELQRIIQNSWHQEVSKRYTMKTVYNELIQYYKNHFKVDKHKSNPHTTTITINNDSNNNSNSTKENEVIQQSKKVIFQETSL